MKEKIFKEKVNDFAVLKIEQKQHQKRCSKFGKLAKLCSGMKPKQFKLISDIMYDTSEDALKRQDKEKKTEIQKIASKFIDAFTSLSLIGESERLTSILSNFGIDVKETYEGAATERFSGVMTEKKFAKFEQIWDDEFAGMEIPNGHIERVKALVRASVEVRSDIENIKEKTTGDPLDAAAEESEVRKAHLTKAVNIAVISIDKGEGEADEKINEILAESSDLVNTLNVLVSDETSPEAE